jgi:hypothetical protein
MTAIPNKRLCVYSHSADGEVFYVGQGNSQRTYERASRTPRWHAHVVEESGGGYEITIHAWTADKAEALFHLGVRPFAEHVGRIDGDVGCRSRGGA